MEWVETTGRTIDEAEDRALDQLGVDQEEAEFEVVDEPKAGLFGRVRREARVRARVRPVQARPKVERRRGRREQGKGPRKDASTPRQRGGGGQGRSRGGSTRGGSSKKDAPQAAAGGGAQRPKAKPSPGGQGRGGGRGGQSKTRDADTATKEGGAGQMETISLDQQVEVMEEFVHGLVEAFGLEARVSSETVDEDVVEIRVEGDDLGLMIGPKGQTLAAVQDLARTVAQRQLVGSHEGRVRLDVAGYRQRRREALRRFAEQVAEDVQSSGVQRVLEPMSAPDRKVVHDAINEIDGVSTTSEGEDRDRRVVVLPE